MIFYIKHYPNVIVLRARAEGDEGMVGDFIEEISPNDTFGTMTYEQLLELGQGKIDIDLEKIKIGKASR